MKNPKSRRSIPFEAPGQRPRFTLYSSLFTYSIHFRTAQRRLLDQRHLPHAALTIGAQFVEIAASRKIGGIEMEVMRAGVATTLRKCAE